VGCLTFSANWSLRSKGDKKVDIRHCQTLIAIYLLRYFHLFQMDPDNISAELTSTCNAVENLLTEAKKKSEDLSNFVENLLGPSFGPAIGIYAKLFKSLKVKSRDELEEKVKSNFRHASGQFCISNIYSNLFTQFKTHLKTC
jgi:hypothetical protein